MTQSTDTEIKELKSSMDTLTGAYRTLSDRADSIAKGTEANTKSIDTLATQTEALASATAANTKAIDTLSDRVDSIVKATEANAKAIADLTLEMRVGFTNLDGKINALDTKIDGKIDVVKADIKGLDSKFDERSKGAIARLDSKDLASRNITTGLTVTVVGGILLALTKLLFGINL